MRPKLALPSAFLAGACVIFDLDGTLVDTAPDLVGTLNGLLAEEGAPPLPLAEARLLIGRGARVLIERGFAADGIVLEPARAADLFDRFIAAYRARIAQESRPYDGVREALAELTGHGARLAVCTNKPTGLSLELLGQLDLLSYFRAVVGPDFAPAAKPDPRHLLAAIVRAGGRQNRPDRAVMVGDSAADATAARAAAVPLVLVRFGYSDVPPGDLKPDALIDRFADVPAACARLLDPCSVQAETV